MIIAITIMEATTITTIIIILIIIIYLITIGISNEHFRLAFSHNMFQYVCELYSFIKGDSQNFILITFFNC